MSVLYDTVRKYICNKSDGYLRKLYVYKRVCFAVGNEASMELNAYDIVNVVRWEYVENKAIKNELRKMVGWMARGLVSTNEK
jgi:hypothetical protein